MSTLFNNIGCLFTNNQDGTDAASRDLGEICDAAIVVEDGKVAWVGEAKNAPAADEQIDLNNQTVIPGFVDSHAHLMFAGDRAEEFSARMQGQSYSAGGIKTTVAATRKATDAQLEANLERLIAEMHASGITTFETKSGYGLDVETESRSLAIAAKHTSETTFLGAHVVPQEFRDSAKFGSVEAGADAYVDLVKNAMLSAATPHAKWIDVFCDRGAFNVDQAREILQAGINAGLAPRIHANQLENIGAIQLAVELDCASADHCTHLTNQDIDALANSNTVATLLPGAEFSTRSKYPDARKLIDAGVTIALATDCNPGSSYTSSMAFCIALAVREMHMSPAEALWSATMGGAKALRRNDIGHLSVGASADFAVINAPSYIHLAYRPGVNLISETYIAGRAVTK
ncbi:imidazolonepropionase [Rhodoluna sp.]|uniref:imidazolonepropionase n=1 Tax=Rhodoluna sp. TaxID=1969481 RepID=UPI0025E3BBAF|nr:imidazolonepropionase [Rhodoluna sp.]